MAAFQSLLSFGFKGTSKIAHFAHQSEGSPVATVLLAARHQWTLGFFFEVRLSLILIAALARP